MQYLFVGVMVAVRGPVQKMTRFWGLNGSSLAGTIS